MMRIANVHRQTGETDVEARLDLDGGGTYDVETGNRFLSHMMETWTRYAGFGLHLRAAGDLEHHLIEDVAIATGQAFRQAFGNSPCRRIAYDFVPMDDVLVLCAVDVVDRPFYAGELPVPIWEHWFRSFAMEARINLHLDHLRGRDTHHTVEACFKAFGRALARAIEPADEEVSTKGVADLSVDGAATDAVARHGAGPAHRGAAPGGASGDAG